MSEKNLKKVLSVIEESMKKQGDSKYAFDYRNPRAIKEGLDSIGIEISKMDLDFLLQLYSQNPNYKTEQLKIPKLKVFEVTTRRQAVMYVTEYWENKVETYVDETYLPEYLMDLQDFNWWDGVKVDDDISSEETTDVEIDDINRIE
jgi:hypothetical protein